MDNTEFTMTNDEGRIKVSDFTKSALVQAVHFGVGVLTAAASNMQYFSPLGIGFVSGTDRRYTLFSSFGAMLGYIVSQDYLTAFRYVMALIIVYILKAYVNTFENLKDKLFVPPFISFFATLSTGAVVTVTSDYDTKVLFFRIAETLMSFGTAYFFTVFFVAIGKIKRDLRITNRELTSLVIATLILLISARDISIVGFSPSGALCSYIILCSAFLFRENGGAVVGTGASIGFALTGSALPTVFCYGAAGLFSGIFSYSGRVLCAMAYIFSYGAVFLLLGGTSENMALLAENAAASLLFILTPQNWFSTVKIRVKTTSAEDDSDAIMNMIVSRLRLVKSAVGDMSGAVLRVSEILKEKSVPDTTGVYLRVRDNVCAECAGFQGCWRKDFQGTVNEFDRIIEDIRKNGNISPSASPPSLQNRCLRIMSLCDSFNKNYSSYSARLGAEGRINEMRKITVDQFQTVCDMLDDMLNDFSKSAKPMGTRAHIVKNALDNMGVEAFVNCYEDEDGKAFVNISISEKCAVKSKEIKEVLEKTIEKEFEEPSVITNGQEKILFFWEITDYTVECIYHQIASKEGDLCGDFFDSFFDGRGNFIAVLSDGMGTGSRAAIDGAMTASMLSRLIISGFSFPCALRLVNSAMLVKSREESLATLDILKVNLYTGKSVIYKAGATASLMKRGEKVSEIKKSAMPIGILRQAEFAVIRGNLKDGDLIYMMSDGATDNSMDEIRGYVTQKNFEYDLPQKICALARSREVTTHDDITVAVVKFAKRHLS